MYHLTEFAPHTHPGLHEIILGMLAASKLDKNAKILDVGCGSGNFLNELHKLSYKNLHGVDGFADHDAITKVCTFHRQLLDVPLEYEDKMFDVLLNIDVIEHMEHPNRLLNEMHRALKDGGTLILSTPNVLTLMSRLIFLFEGNLFQFRDADIPFNGWPGHIAPFFPKLFKEIYKEKFQIESIAYSDWIVPFFGWKVPFRSKLFGNSVILVLKKK